MLLRAADMAAAQDLFVDARAYLNAIREQRWSRGDKAGVAEITIRLAALEPTDYAARLAGARAQSQSARCRPRSVDSRRLPAN